MSVGENNPLLQRGLYLVLQHRKREAFQALTSALGSHAELEYLYRFSKKLGYCKSANIDTIEDLIAEVGRLLWSVRCSF